MKRISILSFIAAAVALGFASCADNTEEFKQGGADSPDCYGVYFPAQKTTLTLDPSEPTIDTIIVARKKTEGAITVPYTLKDENNIFEASELKFDDGQTESYIVVKFDSAQIGETYLCSFLIEDPAYASQYTSNAIALDLYVTRDKWNSLGNASFSDAFTFDGVYEAELLQNDKDKTRFRLMHPYDGAMADLNGYDEENLSKACDYIPLYLMMPGQKKLVQIELQTPVRGEGLVYFEESNTGYFHTTYSQDIMINHPAEFSSLRTEDKWGFNKVLQYQESGLPAGIQLAPYYYMNGVGGWNYTADDGMVSIIFPGAKLTDYSLALKSGFADGGLLDVAFIFGEDVAFVEYSTFDGVLNANKVNEKAETIVAGEDSTVAKVDSTSVITFSFPATGDYTLVAVAYDEDTVAKTFKSIVLHYVADNDSMPVDVDAELITTKKYEKFDYTTENSLEFSVYGSDLISVAIGLFPSKKFYADPEQYVDLMLDDEDEQEFEVDAETLEAINETGYTDLITDLKPGTAYTLVVIASNGYEQEIICKDASTTGVAIPLYMSFDPSDIDDDLLPAAASGYDGSYDFFAIPEDETERQYISTLELKAVDDSTVLATGMFGEYAEYIGVHDSVYFEYFEGVLYTLANVLDGDYDYTGVIRYWSDAAEDYTSSSYFMAGGFVDKDHIAFVDATNGYEMTGWALSAYEGKELLGDVEIFNSPLLATEGLYDELLGFNEPAPSKASLDKLRAALNAPRTNYVETNRGYIRSTIKNFRDAQKIKSSGVKAGLSIEAEPRPVKAKVVGVKAYKISKASIESILK